MSNKYVVTPMGVNKKSMTNTHPMSKSEVCKLLNELERQLKEARGLIANVKADLISIQDITSDPITSLQLGACIKKVKE